MIHYRRQTNLIFNVSGVFEVIQYAFPSLKQSRKALVEFAKGPWTDTKSPCVKDKLSISIVSNALPIVGGVLSLY